MIKLENEKVNKEKYYSVGYSSEFKKIFVFRQNRRKQRLMVKKEKSNRLL